MAGATWNCCSLSASSVYTIEPYKHTCGTVPLREVHGFSLACDKCWSCRKTVCASAHGYAFSLSVQGLDGCFERWRETAYSGEFCVIHFVVCLVMHGIFILYVFVVDLCIKFVLRWPFVVDEMLKSKNYLSARRKKKRRRKKREKNVCGKNDSVTVILTWKKKWEKKRGTPVVFNFSS